LSTCGAPAPAAFFFFSRPHNSKHPPPSPLLFCTSTSVGRVSFRFSAERLCLFFSFSPSAIPDGATARPLFFSFFRAGKAVAVACPCQCKPNFFFFLSFLRREPWQQSGSFNFLPILDMRRGDASSSSLFLSLRGRLGSLFFFFYSPPPRNDDVPLLFFFLPPRSAHEDGRKFCRHDPFPFQADSFFFSASEEEARVFFFPLLLPRIAKITIAADLRFLTSWTSFFFSPLEAASIRLPFFFC